MASEKLDFSAVLDVLEAKRAALDTLIESFKAALSLGALGHPGDIDVSSIAPAQPGMSSGVNGGPVDLPTGAFLNKSIPAAITLYLSAIKKKQTTREIAKALKKGGLESTAKDFEGPITGALNRLRAAEKVLRFPDGWSLAEFYPDHIRASVSKAAGKPKTKKKAKPKKKVGKSRRTAKTASGPGLESRIDSHLQAHASEKFLPADLGGALGADPRAVTMTLARLIKKEKATKDKDGRYSARAV